MFTFRIAHTANPYLSWIYTTSINERTNQSMILMIIVFFFVFNGEETLEQVCGVRMRERGGKQRWRSIEWHISDWLEICFRFSDRFINIRRWVKLVSRLDSPDQNQRKILSFAFFFFCTCWWDQTSLKFLNLCSNSNTMNRRKKIWQVLCERFQSSTHIDCIMFHWIWSYHNSSP